MAKTTLTFLERSRRKVKVDSFYSFLLSPETETQRHGTTTMEEVAGVSKRIGIGIGIGTVTGTAVSRLLPMMREVE